MDMWAYTVIRRLAGLTHVSYQMQLQKELRTKIQRHSLTCTGTRGSSLGDCKSSMQTQVGLKTTC